jgi:menaquinone-dependent protoporphyrinogen oxidase
MPLILVVYASKHGHTAKVAARIASVAEIAGADVHLHDVGMGGPPPPGGFDAVIVGASIHAGRHQRAITEWVRTHQTTLNLRPSAFFSVCLTAAEDTDESRATTRRYRDEFCEETGWTPTRAMSFAGALQYREYDFATRLMVRLLMSRSGHPTDISRDVDYTDWDAVEQFGRDCVGMLEAVPAARAWT